MNKLDRLIENVTWDYGIYKVKEILKLLKANLGITSIVAGSNITVDNTDPKNPIISSSGGGNSNAFATLINDSGISQVISNGTSTNLGGEYYTSDATKIEEGTFTFLEAGKVEISGQVHVSNSTSDFQVYFWVKVNGVNYGRSTIKKYLISGQTPTFNLNWVIDVNPNDTILIGLTAITGGFGSFTIGISGEENGSDSFAAVRLLAKYL